MINMAWYFCKEYTRKKSMFFKNPQTMRQHEGAERGDVSRC